jgi:hypothetical protein
MPEISRFFGIIIAMFYNDHPPPHDDWDSARREEPLQPIAPLD